MTNAVPTAVLAMTGQSIWVDNITRSMLATGKLAEYIHNWSVVGLTSNPTIFEKAITGSNDYDPQINELLAKGIDGEKLFFELAITDLTKAADAFKGVHEREDEVYDMQVYSTVLGGGMSSRLFQEAREKRGLCYSIHAFGASYADTGLFGVYAGTSGADAQELVHVIAGEMKALAGNVDDDELVRAKAQIRSGLLMGLEQASARCEQIAGQYLTFGRLFTPRELIARIDAVDAAAVRSMAARILSSGPMSLAVLGPASQLGSYDKIAGRFA
jgi:predicted Zn-dependent peptidase